MEHLKNIILLTSCIFAVDAFALSNPMQTVEFESGDFIIAKSAYGLDIGQVSTANALGSNYWQILTCESLYYNRPQSSSACELYSGPLGKRKAVRRFKVLPADQVDVKPWFSRNFKINLGDEIICGDSKKSLTAEQVWTTEDSYRWNKTFVTAPHPTDQSKILVYDTVNCALKR